MHGMQAIASANSLEQQEEASENIRLGIRVALQEFERVDFTDEYTRGQSPDGMVCSTGPVDLG